MLIFEFRFRWLVLAYEESAKVIKELFGHLSGGAIYFPSSPSSRKAKEIKTYNKIYAELLAFLTHLTKSEEDAKDIMQETFVNCWVNKEGIIEKKFTRQSAMAKYLFGVARNCYVDHVTRESKQPITVPLELLPEEEGYVVFDEYIFRKAVLYKFISTKVNIKYRGVFIFHLQGVSSRQIADLTGLPFTTVQFYIKKIRHQVMETLAGSKC